MPRPRRSVPNRSLRRILAALCLALAVTTTALAAVDYDIVYVRQPRYGDDVNTIWPEIFHPARAEPGADLMLLHPDGSEEILIDCDHCSVTDPYVSFDGEWVYYAYFYDLREEALNYQRDDLPEQGSDIYRIHLESRATERLTFGEFTPNTGAGNWDETNPLDPPSEFNRLGYGVLNLGPCPLPGGKIAFTSNRNAYAPTKGFTAPTMQLFVMDEDGRNVEAIAPMTIGSALHPTILQDGRLLFSSYESQGLRDERLWGIWAIQPDGRKWTPVVSAFNSPQGFHFMTQLSGGDLVVEDYYNLNNNGFGALYRFPVEPPPGTPRFFSAFPDENPPIDQTVGGGFLYPLQMSFTPFGMYSITPMSHGGDEAAPVGSDGERVGKFTHPSGAPAGDLLVIWTPGPANDLNRPIPTPYYDGGIYVVPGASAVWSPDDLVLVKNDPAYNEAWPRAVVPYGAVHGISEPAELEWLPNDGTLHAELPEGTPYGLVGSSSLYKRESFPGHTLPWANTFDGLDAFNTSENSQSSNWVYQGSDAGLYNNSEIWAVRVLAMEPNTHRSYGPAEGQQFFSHANERLRILGEIPVRKFHEDGSPILDSEGNPDTSFLAKIAADTPFTFQTIDERGLALNMAQTWHQVRPGEVRVDCGGCHAHSELPLGFSGTEASLPGYPVADLTATTPLVARTAGEPSLDILSDPLVDIEFLRDIRPILQARCTSCHTANDPTPPGDLVLDDLALYDGLPGDYKRLADDSGADWGYPPVISNGTWRQTNASRYVRKFQSRRSLLVWKVFGERLDGWTNADHPTESIPGDVGSLPNGASANEADLDFIGTIMPPPDSGVAPLTENEKMTIARWIDLGAPIDTGSLEGNEYGWFLDDLRPTLTLTAPRADAVGPIDSIRFGLVDANSGIDLSSLTVTADFPVSGRAPGSELADLTSDLGGGRYSIAVSPPIEELGDGTLSLEVFDLQGNKARTVRSFSVGGAISCGDIDRSGQRCTAAGTLQAGVRFVDDRYNGDAVTFDIDGMVRTVEVAGTRALLSLPGQSPGSHSVEMIDPPGCTAPQIVICP